MMHGRLVFADDRLVLVLVGIVHVVHVVVVAFELLVVDVIQVVQIVHVHVVRRSGAREFGHFGRGLFVGRGVLGVAVGGGCGFVGVGARRKAHLVLFFEATSRVRKPRGDLIEAHFGDDGEHDLLALGGIRVLAVLVQPGLERGRGLARGVFAPRASRAIIVLLLLVVVLM